MGISRASKIITPWTVEVEWNGEWRREREGGKRSRSQCLRTWTNLHNDRELPAMESRSLSLSSSSPACCDGRHNTSQTERRVWDKWLTVCGLRLLPQHPSTAATSVAQADRMMAQRETERERKQEGDRAKFESRPKTKGARPWQWLRLWLWPRVPKADHSPSSPLLHLE